MMYNVYILIKKDFEISWKVDNRERERMWKLLREFNTYNMS